MKIQVIVATHKPYAMPADGMYLPVHVGAEGKGSIGFTGDNTGDNISAKNNTFCELTGLYWAWKNLDADYVGLAHYRRHFGGKRRSKDPMERVLSTAEAEKLLADHEAILPKKRNYYIETLYSHYAHTCYVEPLDIAGEILRETHPEYAEAFERLKTRKKGHMFNMMILRRDKLDAYCSFLFPLLFELEKRVDASQFDGFHARFFGRVSELMLDVWMEQNPVDYVEVPVLSPEPVNWWKKGTSFLLAKFTGKKYGKSF